MRLLATAVVLLDMLCVGASRPDFRPLFPGWFLSLRVVAGVCIWGSERLLGEVIFLAIALLVLWFSPKLYAVGARRKAIVCQRFVPLVVIAVWVWITYVYVAWRRVGVQRRDSLYFVLARITATPCPARLIRTLAGVLFLWRPARRNDC